MIIPKTPTTVAHVGLFILPPSTASPCPKDLFFFYPFLVKLVEELVVYIEPDSVVEERPEYEFLRLRNFRVKLIRLRGEISQGLCLPVAHFTWPSPIDQGWIGKGVAEIVGARHYEKPVPRAPIWEIKGDFRRFLAKTDEITLRSYPDVDP